MGEVLSLGEFDRKIINNAARGTGPAPALAFVLREYFLPCITRAEGGDGVRRQAASIGGRGAKPALAVSSHHHRPALLIACSPARMLLPGWLWIQPRIPSEQAAAFAPDISRRATNEGWGWSARHGFQPPSPPHPPSRYSRLRRGLRSFNSGLLHSQEDRGKRFIGSRRLHLTWSEPPFRKAKIQLVDTTASLLSWIDAL